MMKLEFHFDFGSPNAYLSHLVISGIESRIGQKIEYIPVLLGGVFKATNNASPAITMNGIKNKMEYQQIEIERFLAKHQITDYQFNPHFPVNTLKIMRGAVFAKTKDYFRDYVNAVYHHMWSEPKKMDELEVIETALKSSGLPSDQILAGMQDPDVKQTLISNTERSVAMGNFGSPTFYANDEIFFGKDKLRDFEEYILENN